MASREHEIGEKRTRSISRFGWLAVWGLPILSLVGLILWKMVPPSDLRTRFLAEHGIHLPPSAERIQCRGDYWKGFLDRGASAMFEMDSKDLATFLASLRVNSQTGPVSKVPGDPLINGYNVWPQGTPGIPSNPQYGGFTRTFAGEAVPVESLSCVSPTGDWLNVEYWNLAGSKLLVKVYTDWN